MVLHFVSAVETVTVVIGSKNLDLLSQLVPEKSVSEVRKGLVKIIISFSESGVLTVGVATPIAGELANNGVNILE